MRYRGAVQSLPLRDESVACIVTSPPYNTDQPYPDYEDRISWEDYSDLAWGAANEMHRVLVPGGRLWINVQHVVPFAPKRREDKSRWVAGRGREERVDLLGIWSEVCDEVGLKYRDVVAWVQDANDGGAAWGSWLRPSAPNLRGGWEPILVMYKDHWKRSPPKVEGCDFGRGTPCTCGVHTYQAPQFLKGDEYEGSWMALTRNVWRMTTRRDKEYPAVFPDELVRRCVLLSTWPGEVVLDPYSGSGTTQRVATAMGRIGLGGDL